MKKVVFFIVSLLVLFQVSLYAATEVTAATATAATATVVTKTDTSEAKETKDVDVVKVVEYGTEISFENAEDGIVTIFYNQKSTKKMKLVVKLGTESYYYNLFNNEEPVNYPLQLGEGDYTVSIYENTTGSKYKVIASEKYTVKYEDEEDANNVYLQSVLEISWNEEDESIKVADELLAEALEVKKEATPRYRRERVVLTDEEIINIIYDFVLETVEYDFEKIKSLDYTYTPDNDSTLETGTGICYDYSSLFASMLRSQGIPAKMVKGYANTSEVYHAWNEVYLADEERWVVVDTTYDAYMAQNDRSYTFEKEAENFNKVKEF